MTIRKIWTNAAIVAGLALLIALFPAIGPSTSAVTTTAHQGTFEYAVKFICGTPPAGSNIVAPGRYFTAINVHNPQNFPVAFKKKVAVALPMQTVGTVSPFVPANLGPDQAFEIDCPDIFTILAPPVVPAFLKGFVVIQSPFELDVVPVYTAAGPGGLVSTLQVDRVPPRRLP